MIDLSKLDPTEAERIAHAEGFTGVAALYSRLSDAEHLNSAHGDTIEKLENRVSDLETKGADREEDLADQVENLQSEVEILKDTLYQCLPFFEDWKDEDGVYKPKTMAFMIKMIRKSLGEAPD